MKFNTTLFTKLTNIEVGCETHKRTIREFDGSDNKIRCINMKRYPLFCNALGRENCTKACDTLCGSKDGGQYCERVNSNVEERAYLIERGGSRMPGFKASPVHLSIC